MLIVVLFVTLVLCAISIITVLNVITFPRLELSALDSEKLPFVSIMIPARNEVSVIGETLHRLLSQDYPYYEIILLDDNSTDGTRQTVEQRFEGHTRLTILQGKPLPVGWIGKNWACHQMAEIANGEYMLFTDADVHWEPGSLSAVIAHTVKTRADLFTVWPTQITISWAERLCVPLMALVILGYLPVVATHHVPLSMFGVANGQCMIWRRDAYRLVRGHQSIQGNILEDVTLARKVKQQHLRLRMADGNKLIKCRMYTDWHSVRDGYAKNILAGYANSISVLILATAFHWLIFLFPWLWLFVGWSLEHHSFYPIVPLSLIVMGVTVRALTAAFTQQRVADALLLPFSVLLMTRIGLQAVWWQFRYGGPNWKGRIVSQEHSVNG